MTENEEFEDRVDHIYKTLLGCYGIQMHTKQTAHELGNGVSTLEAWRNHYRKTGKLTGPPWVEIGVRGIRYNTIDVAKYMARTVGVAV